MPLCVSNMRCGEHLHASFYLWLNSKASRIWLLNAFQFDHCVYTAEAVVQELSSHHKPTQTHVHVDNRYVLMDGARMLKQRL